MWNQIRNRLAWYPPLVRLYKLYKHLRIVRQSPHDNIYYCCTQKTASQWFKAVFSDPIVHKYTGLDVFPYNQLVGFKNAHFDRPLPKRSICAHLYIGYPNYLSIPKPEKYRTFFVVRDPRDIVVSSYFSLRYSHVPIGRISRIRTDLEKLDLCAGLRYVIDVQEEEALFWAQRSWMSVPEHQSDIAIFRYENFACDNFSFLRRLFSYLNIEMPGREFDEVYDRHRFERYSEGRKKGVVDPKSHYRKGLPADWENYFDQSTIAYFEEVTGNLLEVLGYEK